MKPWTLQKFDEGYACFLVFGFVSGESSLIRTGVCGGGAKTRPREKSTNASLRPDKCKSRMQRSQVIVSRLAFGIFEWIPEG